MEEPSQFKRGGIESREVECSHRLHCLRYIETEAVDRRK